MGAITSTMMPSLAQFIPLWVNKGLATLANPSLVLYGYYQRELSNKKKIVVSKLKMNSKVAKDQASKRTVDLKSYIGESDSKSDVGLCTESDKHVSLLRRMRFKIATKIPLQGSIGSLSDGEW
ncbi:hypothetical protein Tco_1312652 [Tanacetum coccineum]